MIFMYVHHIYSASKVLRLKETPCDAYTKCLVSHHTAALAMNMQEASSIFFHVTFCTLSPCSLLDESVVLPALKDFIDEN